MYFNVLKNLVPFKMWTIMDLNNFLSCVDISNICFHSISSTPSPANHLHTRYRSTHLLRLLVRRPSGDDDGRTSRSSSARTTSLSIRPLATCRRAAVARFFRLPRSADRNRSQADRRPDTIARSRHPSQPGYQLAFVHRRGRRRASGCQAEPAWFIGKPLWFFFQIFTDRKPNHFDGFYRRIKWQRNGFVWLVNVPLRFSPTFRTRHSSMLAPFDYHGCAYDPRPATTMGARRGRPSSEPSRLGRFLSR